MTKYHIRFVAERDIEVDEDIDWVEQHIVQDVIEDWANIMCFTVFSSITSDPDEFDDCGCPVREVKKA